MSRAVELAKKTGCSVALDYPIRKPRFTFFEEELEAFYHAARAEALMEAADVCNASTRPTEETSRLVYGLAGKFRAMADREGK